MVAIIDFVAVATIAMVTISVWQVTYRAEMRDFKRTIRAQRTPRKDEVVAYAGVDMDMEFCEVNQPIPPIKRKLPMRDYCDCVTCRNSRQLAMMNAVV